jgi:hypothetical protein
MPKRMSADSPRVRKAQFAKLKLVILELMSVKPYIMADVDDDTRKEMRASLTGAIEKLNSIIRWVDSSGGKVTGPRKGSLKNPIPMGGNNVANDEEEETDA